MALPDSPKKNTRFPAKAAKSKKAKSKITKVLSPAGVGVVLSVGAHLGLLFFGTPSDAVLSALDSPAEQSQAEEREVPLVQLTPAERNRLPDFAQPRRQPTSNPTGLGTFSLPSGLPSIPNTSVPRAVVPAKPFPSASATPTFPRQNRQTITRAQQPTPAPRVPLSFTLPSIPLSSLGVGRRPSVSVVTPEELPDVPPQSASLPANGTPGAGIRGGTQGEAQGSANTQGSTQNGSADDLLPRLNSGVTDSGLSIAEALDQTEVAAGGTGEDLENGNSGSSAVTPPDIARNLPPSGQDVPAEEIPVDTPDLATPSAQGDALLLAGNNEYNPIAVTEEDAEALELQWLERTAEGLEEVATETTELNINSEFKACREDPPVNGRLGVVVNPDGSRSEPTVLKSTGYGTLNRLAVLTLEYEEFDTPDVPTQYKVDVLVKYEPEGCVAPLSQEETDATEE
ncbi:MAG: hypothetical protein AAGC93_27245 [Cyanobacteria bacterium P01_F01_bin.53]